MRDKLNYAYCKQAAARAGVMVMNQILFENVHGFQFQPASHLAAHAHAPSLTGSNPQRLLLPKTLQLQNLPPNYIIAEKDD